MSKLLNKLRRPGANGTANTYSRDIVGNKTDTAVYAAGTEKSLMAYVKGSLASPRCVAKTDGVVLTGDDVGVHEKETGAIFTTYGDLDADGDHVMLYAGTSAWVLIFDGVA